MAIFDDVIASIFGPAQKILANIHADATEKQELASALDKMQTDLACKMADLQGKIDDNQSKQAIAEMTAGSMLQRNWRPASILILLGIIVLSSFGLCHPNDNIYSLFQILTGTLMTSRGFEKIATIIKG